MHERVGLEDGQRYVFSTESINNGRQASVRHTDQVHAVFHCPKGG
jgi:hypothetical protein